MDFADQLETERRVAPWNARFHRGVELAAGALGFLALSAVEPGGGSVAGAGIAAALAGVSFVGAVRSFRAVHGRWPRIGRIDT